MDTGGTDQDNFIFKNSIKYLYELTKLNEINVPTLKSFYSTKSRLMELRRHIYLPKTVTKNTVRCQRCLIDLSDGPARHTIKPDKRNRFVEKLQSKVAKRKPLTGYQKEYIKKNKDFNTKLGNVLVSQCKFCNKESKQNLIKPEKPKEHIVQSTIKSTGKKKKKKDRFCGLQKEAVLSANALATSSGKKKKRADRFNRLQTETVTNKSNSTFVPTDRTKTFETTEFVPLSSGSSNSFRFKNNSHKSSAFIPTDRSKDFDTNEFIPLSSKGFKSIKFKKKTNNLETKLDAPIDGRISKKKAKNRNKLSNLLKNSAPVRTQNTKINRFLKRVN